MRIVMSTIAGSNLYGTKTETSDTDIVMVHIPSARNILTQNCSKILTQSTSNKDKPNTADDSDVTNIPLHLFVKSLELGAMQNALELLFAQKTLSTSPIWEELVNNRHRFVSKQGMQAFRWFEGNMQDFIACKNCKYETSYKVRKTLHHLIRVAVQLGMLFQHGRISFPLVDYREFLLAIKSGEMPREAAVNKGKELLEELRSIIATANIPAQADRTWIDNFVMRHYHEEVGTSL